MLHLSSFQKIVSLSEKIIFPDLKANKEEFCYPEEHYSLIIMDTFMCQDNTKIKELF